ncbi:zinc finger and BTB domain-containing protein 41 [Petromyzon marinus]|uniref:zinc finger and BTB domain-containing protein 41 n=1 Tax=Petromyzon marinus TaxID=7757 RepID=UPI003F6E8A6B
MEGVGDEGGMDDEGGMRNEVCVEDEKGMVDERGEGAIGDEVGVENVGGVEDEVDEGMRWTKGTWWKRWNPFVETVGDCDNAAVVTTLVSAPTCDVVTERPGRSVELAGNIVPGNAEESTAEPLRESVNDVVGAQMEGDASEDVSPGSESARGFAASAPLVGENGADEGAGSPRARRESEVIVQSPLYPLDLLKRLNDDRLGEARFCDVTIAVQDGRFPAHRAVLAMASSYLGSLLQHHCGCATVRLGKAGAGEEEVPTTMGVGSVTSPAFARLMEFLYTAEFRLQSSDVSAVLGTARELQMEEAVRVLTARDAEAVPLGERLGHSTDVDGGGPAQAPAEPGTSSGCDGSGETSNLAGTSPDDRRGGTGGAGPVGVDASDPVPSGTGCAAPSYRCPACPKCFTYKKSFENHVLRHHPAERTEQGLSGASDGGVFLNVTPGVTPQDKAATTVAQTRRSQRTPCPTTKRKLSVAGVSMATEETASRQPPSSSFSVSSSCSNSAGRSSRRSGLQTDHEKSAALPRKRPCRGGAGTADRVIAPSGQYEEVGAAAIATDDPVESGYHDDAKNNILRHEDEAAAMTIAPGGADVKPGDGDDEDKRAATAEDEKAENEEEQEGGSDGGGARSDGARGTISSARKPRARLAERRIPPVLAPLLPTGGKRLFECPRCHKAFDRKGKYACHVRIHTGEKPFSCKMCDQRFTSKSNLTAHAKRHGRRLGLRPARGPRPGRRGDRATVTVPGTRGPSSAAAAAGEDEGPEEADSEPDADAREGRPQLQCQVCDKWFQRRAHLEEHGILHTVATPFPCGFCPESFRSRFARLKHQEKTHLGPFPCNVCGRAFNDSGNLKRHVDCTHGGKKKWTCNVCGKAVRERTTLKEHMRIHSGEKPHLCSVCGQRFRHSSTYRLHVRVHQEDRRYECESCGKTFNRQDHLSKHKKTHSGERTHMCEECGKCFGRRDHLNIHYKSVHLGEKIWQKYKPSLHECEVCKKVFKGKSSLDIHSRTHSGERPFECSICGQGFRVKKSLAKHMVTHSEERPYPCPHCSASFKRKDKLKYHLDHVHWPKAEPAPPSLGPSDSAADPGASSEGSPLEAAYVRAPGDDEAVGGDLRVALAPPPAPPRPRPAPERAAAPAPAPASSRPPAIPARSASPAASSAARDGETARRRSARADGADAAGTPAPSPELSPPSPRRGGPSELAPDSTLEGEALPSELEFLEKYGLAPQPASLLHPVTGAELGGPASRDHAYLGALLSLEDVRGPALHD